MAQKDMARWVAGGIVTVIIGAAPMTWPTLDPSIGVPLLVVLTLALGACIIVGWSPEEVAAKENKHIIPDLRASESADLRAISSGEEWKKLNALLHGGAVTAWSRTKGYKNLRPVLPNRWFNGSLEFIDVDGEPETIIGAPHELRPTPWRITPRNPTDMLDHDVHFSRAQLREHWPGRF